MAGTSKLASTGLVLPAMMVLHSVEFSTRDYIAGDLSTRMSFED